MNNKTIKHNIAQRSEKSDGISKRGANQSRTSWKPFHDRANKFEPFTNIQVNTKKLLSCTKSLKLDPWSLSHNADILQIF